MALSIKALAEGQLPNAKGTLYTVPAVTQTIAVLITLVNSGAGTNNVNIYINSGGTSRRISVLDQPMGTGEKIEIRGPFTLEAADLIEGDATNATEVDYTINGVENA